MKILITGSNGFIGKNLYNSLKENELLGIDSEIFMHINWTDNLKNILNNFKPEVVFHVGACSNTLETDVNYMFIRNYESTKIISEWCYYNNSKLIFSSSAANYGTNNLYPSNLYGWSKYVSEQFVLQNDGICLRYFNVYGPGEESKGKMASIAYQMYIKNKNGENIKLFPGKPSRDFVYINDIIDANIYAWKNYYKLNKKQYFEVGCGESRTFEDVLNILNISFNYFDEKDIPKGYQFYTKSNNKLWMPGWTPKYMIENGLIEYKKYLE